VRRRIFRVETENGAFELQMGTKQEHSTESLLAGKPLKKSPDNLVTCVYIRKDWTLGGN
jgi:hypothetical protein